MYSAVRAVRSSFSPTIRQLLNASSSSSPKGSQTEVCGWIKSVRRQKNVTFAVVSDGSSTRGLQAVFAKDVPTPESLTNGCSVRLRGAIVPSKGAGQDSELLVREAEVLGECDPDLYPIQKQALTVDYLRDQCHLRARADKIGQMLRLRDCLTRSFQDYFKNMGFTYAHTPIITQSDCEGAGEAFPVGQGLEASSDESRPFFGTDAFLTVSSQLHLEAIAHARSRVYTLSPAFRAERSQTNRHLAEFWMLEAEWAFTRHVDEVCDVVEEAIKYAVCKAVEEESVDDDELNARVQKLLPSDKPWSRITYTEAVERLSSAHETSPGLFEFEPSWGSSLQSEHEKWLADRDGCPVFVTDYPASLKPFYMRMNDDGRTVACFDLLVPTLGELVGGSLREERMEFLDKALETHGLLGKEEYEWYRDLRKFGGAPHGGFGLGFERLVSIVSGQPNVRECIPMPRWAGRMLL